MQGSLNTGQSTDRAVPANAVLPPVFWGLPVIAVGLSLGVFMKDSPAAWQFFVSLLGLLYLFWLVCIFRIHQVLARETSNTYPIKPGNALFLNVIAGPIAAAIAWQVCCAATRLLLQVDDLIGEVMPDCLPIANSAVMLLQQYGTYLAVTLACAIGVFCQMKEFAGLRNFLSSRSAGAGFNLAAIAAPVVGVSLVAPGCLWLLCTASAAPNWVYEIDFRQHSLAFAYVFCLAAFAMLAVINHQLAAALRCKVATES